MLLLFNGIDSFDVVCIVVTDTAVVAFDVVVVAVVAFDVVVVAVVVSLISVKNQKKFLDEKSFICR